MRLLGKKYMKNLTKLSLLSAIIIILAVTPIGFIPLGFMRATTIHIPVIIGGILLGWKSGAALGFVFGLVSFLNNTFNPVITSFVFTPFYNFADFSGGMQSLIICFVPRILVGVVAGLLYQKLKNTKFGVSAIAFIASMTNTILVMGGIYFFFAKDYAAARDISIDSLLNVIIGIISINGVIEALIASFITVAICFANKATNNLKL